MVDILLISQTILAVLIVLFVLLQKSSNIGLGSHSGSNDSLFGAKGPMQFLAKATFFVGFIFVANTLALGYQINKDKRTSIVSEFLGETSSAPSQKKMDTNMDTKMKMPEAPVLPGMLEEQEVPKAK